MQKEKFKFNWPLIGNARITEFLEKSIGNNKAAGTYIFNGPDNLGKTTAARYFAKSLLCANKRAGGNLPCGDCSSCRHFQLGDRAKKDEIDKDEQDSAHGDFHIVKKDKDKKNISVEQVRELIKILSMTSFLNSYKVGIIKHADSLSQEAANALLKTLEEPRNKVIIILITDNLEFLPSTIASRSQILNFRLVPADIIYDYLINKYQASRSAAKNFSRLSLGRPALAVKFLENEDFSIKYHKQAEVFIDFLKQDINEKFLAIEELIGKKPMGREAVIAAKRILEVWQGVARDCLLFLCGHNNLIQHQPLEEKIQDIKNRLSIKNILNLIKAMRQAEKYLAANLNPKLVLEGVAVSV